jgi:hypothetical protein
MRLGHTETPAFRFGCLFESDYGSLTAYSSVHGSKPHRESFIRPLPQEPGIRFRVHR